LVGIFKVLNLLFSQKLADAWISLPNNNPMFAGESPLAYMVKRRAGGNDAVASVVELTRSRRVKLPPVVHLRQDDTHHLVPRQYALDKQRPLSRLADDAADLSSITELERSTDNRVLAESGLLPGISIHELVFGVPYAHIVNAAFTYAHPTGSRFNGPERSAWYAAFRLENFASRSGLSSSQRASGDQLASS
jgi:hypothetical protein